MSGLFFPVNSFATQVIIMPVTTNEMRSLLLEILGTSILFNTLSWFPQHFLWIRKTSFCKKFQETRNTPEYWQKREDSKDWWGHLPTWCWKIDFCKVDCHTSSHPRGLPAGSDGQDSAWGRWVQWGLECGRPEFDPWVRKIPWRRNGNPL